MCDSNSSNEKLGNPKSAYKFECLDCENYKRKVIEAEQSVSGRDVLIEMLQSEIKKLEQRYKMSIDDYENLRFKYCTVVQDLSNLKEIHKKLEKSNQKLSMERDTARNQLGKLQIEIENCKKQCKDVPSRILLNEVDSQMKTKVTGTESAHQDLLKEVLNIEAIMQDQNQTVKDVLVRVLSELKRTKNPQQIEAVLQKAYGLQSADVNKQEQDLLATIDSLTEQLKEKSAMVKQLKTENEFIKTQLSEKKSNLSQCLDALEDNHSNLNDLSDNIEMIVKERDKYLGELDRLKKVIDEKNRIIKQKDCDIREYKSKLGFSGQHTETELRKENETLRNSLIECEAELEQLQEDYLEKVKQCGNEKCHELAEDLIHTKSMENIIKHSCKHEHAGKDLEKETDENVIAQYESQIETLNNRIKELENNLEQAKLQNKDCEDENKYYGQKMDTLVTHVQVLEKQKLDNDTESVKNSKLKEEYETLKSQRENEIKELKDEINNLKQDKLQMENNLKLATEERDKAVEEKEMFKKQLLGLQNEIITIQQKDEKRILTLQENIDKLEYTQNEKQKEIDQCCCVIKTIKEKLGDKYYIDEHHLNQMTLMEEENRNLKKQVEALKSELSNFEDCECISNPNKIEMQTLKSLNASLKNDLKRVEVQLCQQQCLNEKLQGAFKEMEVDACRKQCTIHHLEQCLDKSNKILAECEKEIKTMHQENEMLKQQNDVLGNNLKDYVTEAERFAMETNALQEKVISVTRRSQSLENEKYELAKNLQSKSNVEKEFEELKKQNQELTKTVQEKDEDIKMARKQLEALQKIFEATKREHEKLLKAHNDMKEMLSDEIKKYNDELSKMNKEIDNVKVEFTTDTKCAECLNIKELKVKLEEKQKVIEALETQNQELAAELVPLKTYLNRVLADNKILRTAIDNLLTTLVEKLKNFTDNEDSVSLKTNELIVKDILSSLIDLEHNVVNTSTSTERCNCMSVIMSTYKIDGKDPKGRHVPSCKMKCGKRLKDVAKYSTSNVLTSQQVLNICDDCCQEIELSETHRAES